ncbi:type IV pilin [Candidatus Magnetobacterium bavaricum]|uniref:Type IV pilin n=1 Tax=Candidatus Magnetobacterium bavaricum TaxID=29290 RepID=A0A0F3GQQ9_9BACT|nr:type IV pilin [Candidatus Magnetobacterium bavaricum]
MSVGSRKQRIWSIIATIFAGAIFFYYGLYAMGAVIFPSFLFQIPYFVATGWIYYVFHIADDISIESTELVMGLLLLVLLIAGLHIFLKRIEFRRFRDKTSVIWSLQGTVVLAIFVFVADISTTGAINRLVWITKTQKPLKETGRDKAKPMAVRVGAKSAVDDLQYYLDSYVAGKPYIILTDSTGKEGCIEAANAANTGNTCQTVYNQPASSTYTPFHDGMDEVFSDFINHHTNKGNKSPYTGLPLFVAAHTTEGEVVLTPVDERSVGITAYALDVASPIFSSVVTVSSK